MNASEKSNNSSSKNRSFQYHKYMIYDAHTHLNADKLYTAWEGYYNEFIQAWGAWIVTVWMDPKHNMRAIQLAEATASRTTPIKITLWIHPYEVGNWSVSSKQDVDNQIDTIRLQLQEYKNFIVAVGECGIDAHYDGYDIRRDTQQYAFKQQCLLARAYNLPIVIHSRDQFDDTFAIIKHFSDLKIYFHCRWYSPKELQILAEALPNLRVGFCGNVTYPKALPLQASLQTARQLQSQNNCKILFETDAPYLTPQQRRWSTNHPARVQWIYEYATTLLWVQQQLLEDTITDNFLSLYYDDHWAS